MKSVQGNLLFLRIKSGNSLDLFPSESYLVLCLFLSAATWHCLACLSACVRWSLVIFPLRSIPGGTQVILSNRQFVRPFSWHELPLFPYASRFVLSPLVDRCFLFYFVHARFSSTIDGRPKVCGFKQTSRRFCVVVSGSDGCVEAVLST